MFSLIIYELGKHILFFFSLIMIIKMIMMTIVIICNHGRPRLIPQLPILVMMINKNNCFVIGAIITMLPLRGNLLLL